MYLTYYFMFYIKLYILICLFLTFIFLIESLTRYPFMTFMSFFSFPPEFCSFPLLCTFCLKIFHLNKPVNQIKHEIRRRHNAIITFFNKQKKYPFHSCLSHFIYATNNAHSSFFFFISCTKKKNEKTYRSLGQLILVLWITNFTYMSFLRGTRYNREEIHLLFSLLFLNIY